MSEPNSPASLQQVLNGLNTINAGMSVLGAATLIGVCVAADRKTAHEEVISVLQSEAGVDVETLHLMNSVNASNQGNTPNDFNAWLNMDTGEEPVDTGFNYGEDF